MGPTAERQDRRRAATWRSTLAGAKSSASIRRRCYRDMDIGTAKPDAATLAAAPHHLIDIIDPDESYSAAHFRDDAQRADARDHRARQHSAAGRRHHALLQGAARRA